MGEAPFDSMRKMMSTVHRTPENGIIQFTKGAPDEVLKRCAYALSGGVKVPMTDAVREDILKSNKAMADKALRVLCAASREWSDMPEKNRSGISGKRPDLSGTVRNDRSGPSRGEGSH